MCLDVELLLETLSGLREAGIYNIYTTFIHSTPHFIDKAINKKKMLTEVVCVAVNGFLSAPALKEIKGLPASQMY